MVEQVLVDVQRPSSVFEVKNHYALKPHQKSMEQIKTYSKNQKLVGWIEDMIKLCQPQDIHVMDGSREEFDRICADMVQNGWVIKLNEKLRPNSYLARSDTGDVARLESRTFICSAKEEDAGPTNNWMEPSQMRTLLTEKFNGSMRGRTMYVIPFSMGPLGGPISQVGIELTDSPYVAASMYIMTRVSREIFGLIDSCYDGLFVPGLHSVGAPLGSPQYSAKWPSNPDKYIVHFPETREIWSFGSGYGGNALLGKKCFALRIASNLGRDQGWLAEHMLILSVTNTATGAKKYVAAAFPSACGKTNFAMLIPTIPGWKIEVVGDDIAWMRPNPKDGRLYAINPEHGFFGVAPGTSNRSNKRAMEMLTHDTMYTNVALTKDGDVWWEGIGTDAPEGLIDWLGRPYDPATRDADKDPAAHKNSRFAVSINNCTALDPDFEKLEGVPIDAIIFGGRRSDTVPLVYETFDWTHGVLAGATLRSEVTAAAMDVKASIRNDPFAMLPFCGYNMADYWKHWLQMGRQGGQLSNPPRIYMVNWFQRDPNTKKFIWPGFGDNIRVLKWICSRIDGAEGNGVRTPIGIVPKVDAMDLEGLNLKPEHVQQLFTVDRNKWLKELEAADDYLNGKQFAEEKKPAASTQAFAQRMPQELKDAIKHMRFELQQESSRQ